MTKKGGKKRIYKGNYDVSEKINSLLNHKEKKLHIFFQDARCAGTKHINHFPFYSSFVHLN
jgi:hypothetical protein